MIGTCACLAVALTRTTAARPPRGGDAALYGAIVTRVRAGEAYYDATRDELLARHYGLRSVLNWRPPTLARLVASFPAPGQAKVLLAVVAIGTLLAAVRLTKQQGGPILACAVALWLTGELLPAVIGDGYLFSECWAGTLILLSVLTYPRLPVLSAVAALAALFLRELAAPYVVLLAAVAAYDLRQASHRTRYRPTAILLLAGLCAYAAFFLWHALQVGRHVLPTDPAYPAGWVQFGAVPFLLSAVRQNAWLLCLPPWAVAIYLPVAILGLFAWPGPSGRLARPAAIGYLALFAAVGKPFNDYWGLLITPTLGVAFCFGVPAIASLAKATFGSSPLDGAGRQAGHEVTLQREE